MDCFLKKGVVNNVQNLLQCAISLWKVELASNSQNFGNVAIKKGNLSRGLPSTIHNWSFQFNTHSKKV